MLLAPELDQRLRKPTTLPQPAVNPGVAGGAKRNEQFLPVKAGESVVDGSASRPAFPAPRLSPQPWHRPPSRARTGIAVSRRSSAGNARGLGSTVRRIRRSWGPPRRKRKTRLFAAPSKAAAERVPAGGNRPGSLKRNSRGYMEEGCWVSMEHNAELWIMFLIRS